MLRRDLEDALRRLARHFPVVAITGPRQSGKTTLARQVFADKPYVSLEDPAERAFAETDSRGFLARFPTAPCSTRRSAVPPCSPASRAW